MPETYTREQIRAAFEKWLAEKQPDWPEASDPDDCTTTLCNYMNGAQQPEPV